jgi:hypothetical protein
MITSFSVAEKTDVVMFTNRKLVMTNIYTTHHCSFEGFQSESDCKESNCVFVFLLFVRIITCEEMVPTSNPNFV